MTGGPGLRGPHLSERLRSAGWRVVDLDCLPDRYARRLKEANDVGDVLAATVAAAERGRRGSAYNRGGGKAVALVDVIAEMAALLGRPVRLDHRADRRGDPRRTDGDTARARDELDFRASTPLTRGPANQVEATLHAARLVIGVAG